MSFIGYGFLTFFLIKILSNSENMLPIILDDPFIQYDEKTKRDELNNIKHTPNIMPKMFEKSESTELEDESLLSVPEQKIEPPIDNDDKE